jgi:hypothetical protein
MELFTAWDIVNALFHITKSSMSSTLSTMMGTSVPSSSPNTSGGGMLPNVVHMPLHIMIRSQPRPPEPKSMLRILGWKKEVVQAMGSYIDAFRHLGNLLWFIVSLSPLIYGQYQSCEWRRPSRLSITIVQHITKYSTTSKFTTEPFTFAPIIEWPANGDTYDVRSARR